MCGYIVYIVYITVWLLCTKINEPTLPPQPANSPLLLCMLWWEGEPLTESSEYIAMLRLLSSELWHDLDLSALFAIRWKWKLTLMKWKLMLKLTEQQFKDAYYLTLSVITVKGFLSLAWAISSKDLEFLIRPNVILSDLTVMRHREGNRITFKEESYVWTLQIEVVRCRELHATRTIKSYNVPHKLPMGSQETRTDGTHCGYQFYVQCKVS